MQINLIARDNAHMEDGDLDRQIIEDLNRFIEGLESYQENHLDVKIKGNSCHYEKWAKDNKDKIRYARRLLECMHAMPLS